MESDRASSTQFNNVTSLGINYSWDNGSHGNPCTGLLGGVKLSTGEWIKRTKTVSIDVRNLDLLNSGNGAVVEGMAASQDKYTNTEKTKVYANGAYVGEGRLSDYSISEGSQTNDVTTSLSYIMPDGGPDDTTDFDGGEDDPVSWTSSVTVSRDVKAKKYTISEKASASFGNDFDLVTTHSLYEGNENYASAEGRLVEAEQWANDIIFTGNLDWNDYIDLSAYAVASGWNLSMLGSGESGVKSSSSFTRDYINGNYSSTRTTSISYTGKDLDSAATGPYHNVTYTMSAQNADTQGGAKCTKATMKGTVKGVGGGSLSNADAATSGYNEWKDTAAADKLKEFISSIQDTLGNDYYGALNSSIKNSISTQCVTSTNQGAASNDGSIAFSLDMDNCPANSESDTYSANESTNTSNSNVRCAGANRPVVKTTVKGSINGKCGLQLDADGGHPRWDGIESTFDTKKTTAKTTAENAYNGSYADKNQIISESSSYNPYSAKGDYTVVYSDSPWKNDCTPNITEGCYTVSGPTVTSEKSYQNVVRTLTNVGWVSQAKGTNIATVRAEVSLTSATSGDCADKPEEFLDKAKEKLNDTRPGCVITKVGWTFQKEYLGETSITAYTEGID